MRARRNVLVIISDTLRLDHLGCTSRGTLSTPALDRLTEDSAFFVNHLVSNFPTMPARADFLTGKFTFSFMGWEPLQPDLLVLPQIFAAAGYVTMAIVDTPFYVRNGFGYDRGFQDFQWVRGQGDNLRPLERVDSRAKWIGEEDRFAMRTLASAERWLEHHYHDEFFLVVDTWDPHEPWDPPEYYTRLYDPAYAAEDIIYPAYGRWEERGVDAEDLRRAHAAYCGEITMVDRAVASLLSKIDVLGIRDDTLVVFFSDHGFYFGEHGFFGKAVYAPAADLATPEQFWEQQEELLGWSPLYSEVTRVPLLVRGPEVAPGRRQALTTLPDLAPTLLDWAGIDIPAQMNGASFLAVARGETNRHRSLVVSSWPLEYSKGGVTRAVDSAARRISGVMPLTITSSEFSAILGGTGDRIELYDLNGDPGEQQNVWPERSEDAAPLIEEALARLAELGAADSALAERREALVAETKRVGSGR